jgi:hypothetical protein
MVLSLLCATGARAQQSTLCIWQGALRNAEGAPIANATVRLAGGAKTE